MKYIKLFIIGILILSYTSCSEDFLTKDSETFLTANTFYATEADFEAAINGAYAPLRTINTTRGEIVMSEVHSDNSRYFYNTANRGVVPTEHIADFVPDANAPQLGTIWTNYYLIISRSNQILALIDEADISDEVRSNIKGQALFLRGFSYTRLATYFGDIPLHLTPVSNKEEAALPRTATSAIFAQVVQDLSDAIGLLPVKSAQSPVGKVTKGAANALLGDVYMILKDYSNAESQFSAVITSGEYALLSDYASVFDPGNKNNEESIFEVQFLESSDGFNSDFIFGWLPVPMNADELARITGVSNPSSGGLEGFNIPSPELIEAYEAGDLRKVASIDTCLMSDGTRAPYAKKFAHTYALNGIAGDNWPVYRYSEILLFMAEAVNEQGRTSEAAGYLNQVRTRAGLANTTATIQGDMQTAIWKERRVELALEGKRWFDLVRTDRTQEVLVPYGQRVRANPQRYYFPVGFDMANTTIFSQIEPLFDIPASETLVSPYL